MQVTLTREQENLISKLAQRTGKDATALLKESLTRMLEDESRRLEAAQKGFASLDRGEFIEHDEVEARIGRLLS